MAITNLGRVQGASEFTTTAASGTSVAISTLKPTSIKPLVGDSILFPNGDLRNITAVNSTTATCGGVIANFSGTNGTNGKDGTDGVSITQATAGVPIIAGNITTTPIAFTFSNGTQQTVNVQAQKGEQGAPGMAASGEWKLEASGTTLYFKYGTTNVMYLTSNGDFNIMI